MEISAGAKRRFAKDTGIPIHVFKEPYFSYLIDLYGDLYASRAKYNDFQKLMERMADEEAFFAESQRIIDDIVKTVSAKGVYKEKFNGNVFPFASRAEMFKTKNIYTNNFNRKALVSIDLKQANFQCMQYFNGELFDYAPNFETYLLRRTDYSYFVGSKHLRQVIFGNLNPKRQQSIQKHMMSDLLHFLMHKCDLRLNEDNAFFMSPDEIIILYDDCPYYVDDAIEYVRKVEQSIHTFNIETNKDLLTRVELFDLFRLDPHDMFIKRTIVPFAHPKNFEIKHVPAYFIPQIIKYLTNEPVCENDLVFYYENQVCRFMEPLTFNECEGARACR